MSSLGKLSLSLSGLCLIIVVSTSWILGGWLPVLYIFLALCLLGIILALVVDFRLYVGFLLMRTTKNGMSMGVSILITLVLCFSLGYISVSFEKSMDITEEKINSLAPQTIQLLDSLKDNMQVVVFYKGVKGKQEKEQIKQSLRLIKKKSAKIKERYYDVYISNKEAQEYLNELANKKGEDTFIFVEYKGKKVLVEHPFNEEKMLSAMIKATRREGKTVYFLTGHGERDISSESGSGVSELKKALGRSSFNVKTWNFVQEGELPQDVSALVVAGPEHPFLEKELEWMENYLKQGGRLLVAIDPDKKHNLKGLLKKFNVDYKSHYIMDQVAALVGQGKFSPIGVYFDKDHSVTKSFQQGAFSIFHVASDLKAVNDDSSFLVTELVKTNPNTVSIPDITQKKIKGERGSHTLALMVEKAEPVKEKEDSIEKKSKEKDEKKQKKSSMVLAVFGDSDFLSNDLINSRGMNRDLIMNTVSYLVDESDLVSIRPKRLKATQLILKSSDQMMMVLIAIVLPILFFISSFVIWFRRREA